MSSLNRHLRSRLTYANVVASLALFIALSGTSYAALVVTGRQIKDSTVTGADVKDRSLSARDFAGSIASRGTDGRDGRDGARGETGPTGATGATGPRGETGSKGDPCLAADLACHGPQGAKGDPGTIGAKGEPGSSGVTGEAIVLTKQTPGGVPGGTGTYTSVWDADVPMTMGSARSFVVTWKAGLSESVASSATVRCRLYLADELADSAMSSSQSIILTGAALFSYPEGGNQGGTLYDRRINVTCNSPTITYPFQSQKVILTEVASISRQQVP